MKASERCTTAPAVQLSLTGRSPDPFTVEQLSFNQFFDIVNANIDFGPMGVQCFDNVILGAEEDHDHILRHKEFFEKGAHFIIGDGIRAAFAAWWFVNGSAYLAVEALSRCFVVDKRYIVRFALFFECFPKARVVGQVLDEIEHFGDQFFAIMKLGIGKDFDISGILFG